MTNRRIIAILMPTGNDRKAVDVMGTMAERLAYARERVAAFDRMLAAMDSEYPDFRGAPSPVKAQRVDLMAGRDHWATVVRETEFAIGAFRAALVSAVGGSRVN